MSYTLLDIANSALVKIGAKPVQSIQDDTPSGRLIALRLRPVMDTILTMYPFTCSQKRVVIAPKAILEGQKYQYVFDIPSDMLRMISIEGKGGFRVFDFDHVGSELFCGYDPLTILYCRSMYNVEKVDFDLAEAISLYLAYDICERITENQNRRRQLYEEFSLFFAKVKTVDSQKGGPQSYGPINVYGPAYFDHDRPNELIDSRVR